MPDWLIKVLLGLVLNIGLPLAKTLLPWVPPAVWEAIADILKHVTHSDDPQPVAHEFRKLTKECIGTACSTDVVS